LDAGSKLVKNHAMVFDRPMPRREHTAAPLSVDGRCLAPLGAAHGAPEADPGWWGWTSVRDRTLARCPGVRTPWGLPPHNTAAATRLGRA